MPGRYIATGLYSEVVRLTEVPLYLISRNLKLKVHNYNYVVSLQYSQCSPHIKQLHIILFIAKHAV